MFWTSFFIPHPFLVRLTYWTPHLIPKGRMILAWGLGNMIRKRSEQPGGPVSRDCD